MKQLFRGRWLLLTVLVVIGVVIMLRLGIWQLDRLDQRRAANALLAQRVNAPPLSLNTLDPATDWSELINRPVIAQGVYDLSQQVAVQYQTYQERPGVTLITPLRLNDGQSAVLVNRGWLPLEQSEPSQWAAYAVSGVVTVTGYVQAAGPLDAVALTTPGSTARQSEVLRLNVAELQAQIPYSILPVYVLEAAPSAAQTTLPYRVPLDLDLSEGPHLSYAIQWFAFAVIFGGGYWAYLRRQTGVAPD